MRSENILIISLVRYLYIYNTWFNMFLIMGWKSGLILFLSDIMIVYKRKLKKEDIIQIKDDEELIYYYNNNIAFIINRLEENNYIMRKKKIFNNQLMDEKIKKTAEQIIKIVQ